MLGEGATTAAPVQLMRFDEAAFDRTKHPRRPRLKWLALGASVVVAIIIIL